MFKPHTIVLSFISGIVAIVSNFQVFGLLGFLALAVSAFFIGAALGIYYAKDLPFAHLVWPTWMLFLNGLNLVTTFLTFGFIGPVALLLPLISKDIRSMFWMQFTGRALTLAH